MSDFYPLVAGRRWEYETRSSAGPGTLVLECLAVKGEEADFRRTARIPGRPEESSRYLVKRGAEGVFLGGELEFPFPLAVGRAWDRAPRRYSVEALDGVTDGYQNCLVVLYTIAGGDAGFGRRYYAADVGLVRESCADEGEPFEIVLVRTLDR